MNCEHNWITWNDCTSGFMYGVFLKRNCTICGKQQSKFYTMLDSVNKANVPWEDIPEGDYYNVSDFEKNPFIKRTKI